MARQVVFVHGIDGIDQSASEQVRPSSIDRRAHEVVVVAGSHPDGELSPSIVGDVDFWQLADAGVSRWHWLVRIRHRDFTARSVDDQLRSVDALITPLNLAKERCVAPKVVLGPAVKRMVVTFGTL